MLNKGNGSRQIVHMPLEITWPEYSFSVHEDFCAAYGMDYFILASFVSIQNNEFADLYNLRKQGGKCVRVNIRRSFGPFILIWPKYGHLNRKRSAHR